MWPSAASHGSPRCFPCWAPATPSELIPGLRRRWTTPAGQAPALAYRVAGVTKILTLRPHDIPTVRAALARYQRVLRELERQVQASVAALRERRAREKTAGLGRRR